MIVALSTLAQDTEKSKRQQPLYEWFEPKQTESAMKKNYL